MNWKTTILSVSEMSSDGDVALSVQTEFSFGVNDFYSNLPGYERIEEIVLGEMEELFGDKGISWLRRWDVYPEYELAGPDREEDQKSWGRLIWSSIVDVNADTQEQVDALIGLTHEGTDWRMPPF